MTQQENTLRTVKQFSKVHPAFSEGSLRWLIYNAQARHTSQGIIEGNGMERALVRVGRRVLINESIFFEWINAQKKIGDSCHVA